MDNILLTYKTLFIIKNRYILSAITNAMASFFYFLLIVKLSQTNSITHILVVSFAVFLGTLIPQYIMGKYEKDSVWVYEITPKNPVDGRILADTLRRNNIATTTYVTYTKEKEKTLEVKAYSPSKEYSKLIESLIPDTYVYSATEVKNYGFYT